MIDKKTLGSFDNFFYYGKNDFQTEVESDLLQLLIQPKRSMLYNRQMGAGITSKENFPNTLSLQVMLRYDIISAIAYRNTVVTDGTDGTRDLRIAGSQFAVNFIPKGDNLDIQVLYFSFANTNQVQSINIPSGGA